ncbi:MAG TPA: hypothetical protein VN982_16220 [Candidatus Dormibacteraeota bacterium]|nr:hypothetical protein [Candidatus Dormibacteraeota bacterium]
MKSPSLLLVITLVAQSALIAATPSSHPQSAQTPSQKTTQVEKIKAELQKHGTGEKARVKVTLRDKTQMKGSIILIEESSFSITDTKAGGDKEYIVCRRGADPGCGFVKTCENSDSRWSGRRSGRCGWNRAEDPFFPPVKKGE